LIPQKKRLSPSFSTDRERGQAVVIIAIFMLALLGVAALVIDYGNVALQRRALQNSVDASALAGASSLAGGWTSGQQAAQSVYLLNGSSSDQVTYQQSTDFTSGDSVTVSSTRSVPTFFAAVLGINSAKVSATATATIQSFTQVNAGVGVMPWGVLQGSYTPGQNYPIYTKDTANANNGAISLPYELGQNCPVPSGANAYSNEISGDLTTCPISVGETVNTKPGNNSGPTAQGLNARIDTWETVNQVVQFNADGTTTLIDPNSQQLVLIPILTNQAGQSAWPNGSSAPMTVVGFAWFVITSCGDPAHPTYCANSDGKQVNGVFVNLDSDPTVGTSGSYNPGSNTAYTVSLTQ
jgi:Flp pilus assembly protein TadG